MNNFHCCERCRGLFDYEVYELPHDVANYQILFPAQVISVKRSAVPASDFQFAGWREKINLCHGNWDSITYEKWIWKSCLWWSCVCAWLKVQFVPLSSQKMIRIYMSYLSYIWMIFTPGIFIIKLTMTYVFAELFILFLTYN